MSLFLQGFRTVKTHFIIYFPLAAFTKHHTTDANAPITSGIIKQENVLKDQSDSNKHLTLESEDFFNVQNK